MVKTVILVPGIWARHARQLLGDRQGPTQEHRIKGQKKNV